LARLQRLRVKSLLHQDVDVELVRLLDRRAIRCAQLQTSRTGTHLFSQRQRLFNAFARVCEVAALLLRSRDTFECDCRAAQVVDIAKCREGRHEVFEGFLRLVQRDVNLAEVGQREGFMTNVPEGTLNLKGLAIRFQSFVILAHSGIRYPDLTKYFSSLSAI